MLESNQIEQVIGQPVNGAAGDKLGKVGQIYLDDTTGNPEWATIQTGLFGTKESFVPLTEAELTESGLSVPYTKDQVKQAPQVEAEHGHLSPKEESELYRHYGLQVLRSTVRLGYDGRYCRPGPAGHLRFGAGDRIRHLRADHR